VRLRFGASMPEKGGRPCVVGVEVRRAPNQYGRRRWHFVVGHVERVRQQTIQGTVDVIRDLVLPVSDVDPCVFVDAGTAQGFALRRSLRTEWPDKLHRPHAYQRTRFDNTMFATFLEAYADGRITFRENLPWRKELDRSLILYRAGGVSQAGDELSSEDEAMVHALALAIMFPTHGAAADDLVRDDPEPAPV
jgi:hypothetical protein